ncbi:MAG: HPr(Ser) kinase/phosphatase [Gammaproteobacteria bacterium]|jgi:HPr kinase/phosphorylase|nr:MAG: HPr(Ser) kinase/phosphatase [Gammaproteobacteria bacterium]
MTEYQSQISVADLFKKHGNRLGLSWAAGVEGGGNLIYPELKPQAANATVDENAKAGKQGPAGDEGTPTGKSLVGYLNLVHPNQVEILGRMEMDYLEGLRDITRHDTIKQVFKHNPACLIVADDRLAPTYLRRKCNEENVPLFASPLSSGKLSESLHYYLSTLFADVITLHGVYMEVMAIGVLITGPSGIGKSELALELISRGHRLIADDAPQFSRIAPDILNGSCPDSLRDFLEVRGLGVINIRRLYGGAAIKGNKYLRLIVRLAPLDRQKIITIDRLEGSYRPVKILDVEIPEITIPVAPGRNLAILTECAARNHALRLEGYNAAEEFIKGQQQQIEQSGGG